MTKKSREARSVIAGSGHQGTLTGRKYAALGERCTSVSCHQWPRYGWQPSAIADSWQAIADWPLPGLLVRGQRRNQS